MTFMRMTPDNVIRMPARQLYSVRLSDAGLRAVREFAAKETGGNASEMIRILLAEALTARQKGRPA